MRKRIVDPPYPDSHSAVVAGRWLLALGGCIATIMLLLGGLAAYSARDDAWQLAERQSVNLLLALERDIARNIAMFDLSLQGVVEALAAPGIDAASQDVRRLALFDRAAGAEDLGTIAVIGASGEVLESSGSLPKGLSFAGRSDFTFQRDHPGIDLYLGRAAPGWFPGDRPSIWMSRPLPLRDGRFAGVVTGALRLDFFRHLFERIDIGPRGSITLSRTDGHIVWRYPSTGQDVDRDLNGHETFRRMITEGNGRHVGPSAIDGVTRLYTFGRVGDLPLILSVNLAVDDVYERWRQKAAIIGPVIVTMCAAVLVLCLLFRREMLRRAAAEQALARAAQRFSQLAATDALTGLANRRALEDAADQEWLRAFRDGTMLSLLMIDVDYFKKFNDSRGHQEGDRVLETVASAIRQALHRPGDLVARYGGEEFVALLPGCNAMGARIIAERVRKAVGDLAIPHAAGLDGRVTVSIGAATAHPGPTGDVSALLASADRQLYVAKRNGRNVISAIAVGGIEAPLA